MATLGTIIDDTQKRDAIHLAVIPAIASTRLKPGAHVMLYADRALPLEKGHESYQMPIGIVDPFLKKAVEEGERFWLVIYPRVITSLRHVWTHPRIRDEQQAPGHDELPDPNKAVAAEAWLRAFCEANDAPSYDDLLIAVRGGVVRTGYGPCHNDGEYLTIMGTDAHCTIPPEFWDHIEAVTGLKNLPRAQYFSCSC